MLDDGTVINVPVKSSYSLDGMQEGSILSVMQMEYSNKLEGMAQGSLSNEEWANTSLTEKMARTFNAKQELGASPYDILTKIVEQALESGNVKIIDEKIHVNPTISQGGVN